MSRILLTPGVKERVSANVGRMLAMYNPHDKPNTKAVEGAVAWALAIEEAVTEALCPTDIEGD